MGHHADNSLGEELKSLGDKLIVVGDAKHAILAYKTTAATCETGGCGYTLLQHQRC